MKEQLGLDFLPEPVYQFDNYIPGQNLQVYEQLLGLQPGRLVYLFGPSGTGKTHLLHALANQLSGVVATDLLPRDESQPSIIEQLPALNSKLIAIDDLEQLNEFQQSALFNLINHWHAHKNSEEAFSLVISGKDAPRHTQIREDLRNRLGWDLALGLHPLKDEDILLAIEMRAYERGIKINKDACRWLTIHADRDIPTLYAWIDALDRYSIAQRRMITLPLIKQFIANHSPLNLQTSQAK